VLPELERHVEAGDHDHDRGDREDADHHQVS
jgi:hypothetical protein